MCESAYIASLHHIIFCGIAASVQCKVTPDQAIIVPLVQKLNSFLGSVLCQLSVVKAVYIEFLIGNIRIDKGLDQSCCSPAYIIAHGVRNHLISVSAKQSICIVSESDQHIFKFLLGGRLL